MNTSRIALGFDLRIDQNMVMKESSQTPLSQVLAVGVTHPLSADPSVWRRVDSLDSLIQGNPNSFWNPLTLCGNLEGLLRACEDAGIATEDLVRVGLTSSASNTIALVERYGPGWFEGLPTEETLLREGWVLEGFDVVDLRGLISGLNGCGYRPDSLDSLRHLFGSSLNDRGLFDSPDAAAQFGETRGLQIHEHAPFVVVGVLVRRL